MTITLYTLRGADPACTFSPHCWKAVMALKHKGLDFEERPLRFTDIARTEGGFSKTVPMLRDDGHLVSDSFAIAEYLEESYPEHPSLFGGDGGRALSRFVEAWSQSVIHPAISRIAVHEIWELLDPEDQPYFRESRETRLGNTLEGMAANSPAEVAAFDARLEPLRALVKRQPFLGGEEPLFADYIVFGALQWLRIVSTRWPLAPEDGVTAWFERCLDLFGEAGRKVRARAG